MTAQVLETITIGEHELEFDGFPFDRYLESVNGGRKFPMLGTHCYRGYTGKYCLRGRQLYLTEFRARKSDNTWVGLDFFFPGVEEVPVTWNFDPIRVPLGDLIHIGDSSCIDRQFDTFQVDAFLHFTEGNLSRVELKANDTFEEVLALVADDALIDDSQKLSAWIDRLYDIQSPNGRLISRPLNIMLNAEDAAADFGVTDEQWKAAKDTGFIKLDIEIVNNSDSDFDADFSEKNLEDIDWDEPF